ncbi:BadF/BadG/BcrA/BcrD ATPase family protein [Citreimonas salinaria]|uniref:Glucosamine kinase n=1 Tax=Citreimonas salinaria TaxID=321339 RepID=A0A1H3EW44_9RHOB|nr:BadF/BadG/BcrA/BcrD ATPase family protein [Citreimonas salinaria]SDX82850.1 glucosamine kinase [Citreimonas salinaria]
MNIDGWRLGVDGGGTRCRFALQTPVERHSVVLGGVDVSGDFDGAVATLRAGLQQLATLAGLEPGALARVPAHLGLSGVVDSHDADRLRAALGLPGAAVADDRPAAVRGALGREDGFVAGLGTGAFFARQRDGQIRLAGGWGPALGDDASGAWLARRALAATLAVVDGLGEESPLTAGLLLRFDGSPRKIVRFAARVPPAELAALAPLVTEAAAHGDAVARDLLKRGAAHVMMTLRRLGHRAGDTLCLTGGVGAAYAPYLPADMAIALVEARAGALEGALELAGRGAAPRRQG